MFFDEQADPGKRAKLIHRADSRQEVERLAAILLAHMEQTDDPQTEPFKTVLAESHRIIELTFLDCRARQSDTFPAISCSTST